MKAVASHIARAVAGLALAASTIALAGAPLAAPIRASAPGAPAVSMTAEGGFSGYIRPQTWMPVRVSLSNTGDPVDGAIVVDAPGADGPRRLTAPVSLPRGSRKQVLISVPGDVRIPSLRYIADGLELATASIGARSIAPEDRLVVVISDPPDGYNFLADIRTPYGGRTYVAPLRMEQLPDHSAALDSVDAILISNADSSVLNADQRAALQSWLVAGGHLILSGGPNAPLTAGGFSDLVPAAASGAIVQRSVVALAQFTASRSLTSVAALSADAPAPIDPLKMIRDGVALVGPPEAPLVARRDLGRGMLDQLAFDASLAPLRDWRSRAGLFDALLGGRVEAVADFGQVRNELSANAGAAALPATALPPFGAVALFLLAYAMFVGPVNFLALRRFGKMRWAWLSVPAIVVGFTALGIGMGFRLRGNNPILHRSSLVFADARVPEARTQALVGVFSPRQATVDVDFGRELPEPAASAPSVSSRPAIAAPEIVLSVGATSRVTGLRVPSASVKAFVARGEAAAPAIASNAEYLLDETPPRLALAIRNDSDGDFQDCIVSSGRSFAPFGALPPGKTAQIPLLLRGGEPHLRQYGLGATYGYGLGSTLPGVRTGLRTGPFDNPGSNMADMTLTWRKFDKAELREEADRGLINTFFSPVSRGGEGVLLMCWELRERAPTEVEGASYVDRGLRIWRLGMPTYRPAAGQVLPSEFFEWSVSGSSSTVAWTADGLQLSPGAHILALRPWFDLRPPSSSMTGTLRLEFTTGSSATGLTQSTTSVFDWAVNQFAPVRRGLASRGSATLVPISGAYVSTAGEIILRIDVLGDAVTLSDLDLAELTLK